MIWKILRFVAFLIVIIITFIVGVQFGKYYANRDAIFGVLNEVINSPKIGKSCYSQAEVMDIVQRHAKPSFSTEPKDFLKWLERQDHGN